MPMDTLYLLNHRRISEDRTFSLLPRKCSISGKSIWFKKCVVVTTMITGPGDVLFERIWCDSKEFFLNEFKRKQ